MRSFITARTQVLNTQPLRSFHAPRSKLMFLPHADTLNPLSVCWYGLRAKAPMPDLEILLSFFLQRCTGQATHREEQASAQVWSSITARGFAGSALARVARIRVISEHGRGIARIYANLLLPEFCGVQHDTTCTANPIFPLQQHGFLLLHIMSKEYHHLQILTIMMRSRRIGLSRVAAEPDSEDEVLAEISLSASPRKSPGSPIANGLFGDNSNPLMVAEDTKTWMLEMMLSTIDSAVHRDHAGSFDAAVLSLVYAAIVVLLAVHLVYCLQRYLVPFLNSIPADYVSAGHVLVPADSDRIC
ncbi:hypothetical protein Tco_1246443 [Tanacetum coccineum]